MSKIGNHVVGVQSSADYRFGWESAERGEPSPIWLPTNREEGDRLEAQRLGWRAYRDEQVAP